MLLDHKKQHIGTQCITQCPFASLRPPLSRKCLQFFFPPWSSATESYKPCCVTLASHSTTAYSQPLLGYQFPQIMRMCPRVANYLCGVCLAIMFLSLFVKKDRILTTIGNYSTTPKTKYTSVSQISPSFSACGWPVGGWVNYTELVEDPLEVKTCFYNDTFHCCWLLRILLILSWWSHRDIHTQQPSSRKRVKKSENERKQARYRTSIKCMQS